MLPLESMGSMLSGLYLCTIPLPCWVVRRSSLPSMLSSSGGSGLLAAPSCSHLRVVAGGLPDVALVVAPDARLVAFPVELGKASKLLGG